MARALAFLLLGSFSLAGQTALFREYLVAYDGNELGAGFFLSSWLLWVGIGAALALALLRRRPGVAGRFAPLLALYPPALLLQLVLIRAIRTLAGVAPTDIFPSGSLFLATLLTNAPVSFVTGLLFPIASAAGRGVTRVYVLESLGAFLGGVLVTLLLLSGAGALPALPAVSLALAATGFALCLVERRRVGAAAHGAIGAACLALLLTPLGAGAVRLLDRLQWNSRYPSASLIATTETPHGRLSVASVGDQRLAVMNGEILAAVPGGDAARADAALLAAQPARIQRVAILGSGGLALAREMLFYPVETVTLLVPDRGAFRFIAETIPGAVPRDPRFDFVFGDPRRAAPPGPFDLFVVDAGDPDTALAARFFTSEFYRFARGLLAPDGVLAVALSSAENYFGSEMRRYGASVAATLSAVFPEVAVTPGERAWFLASPAPDRIAVHPDVVEERLRTIEVRERRFEPERAATLLEPRRVEFVREMYATAPEDRPALVSTDERPVVYLLNLLVLGRMEGSGFSRAVLAIRAAGPWIFLAPLLALLAVRLRYVLARPAAARAGRFAAGWLLASVGAASIALDLVLLLAFQSRFGLLFERVGLAHALFMLGLAAGGLAGRKLSPAVAGALAGAFALALPALEAAALSEAAYFGLFAAAGTFCGAPFTAAARLLARRGATAESAGGLLEAADHFGGAFGAALAGVLLVPLFGAAAVARSAGLLLLSGPALFLLETAAAKIPDGTLPRLRRRLSSFPYVRAAFTLFALVAAAALLSAPVRHEMDRPLLRPAPERLRAAFPADRYAESAEPFVHFDASEEGDPEPSARLLATRAVVEDVSGYGGPLNLLLAMDREGLLRHVSLLESKETPTYIRELPDFLSRFAGKSALGDFRLVDSGKAAGPNDLVKITGASVTCRAAVETVNRAKNRVLRDLLGRPAPEPAGGGPPLDRAAAAVLVALALAVPVHLYAGRRVRLAFLAAVVVVLGFLENQQLSLAAVLDLLAFAPPPFGNLALFILVLGALALGVAFGQVYCGCLCPFGAAQELLGELRGLRRVSPEVDRRARFLKHVVLATTALAFLLLGSRRAADFDPLAVAFSLKAGPVMWALIGLCLAASVFYFRFWCRYLCPVGAFLSLTNRIALLARLSRPVEFRRCDLGVRSRLDMDCLHCHRCLARGEVEA